MTNLRCTAMPINFVSADEGMTVFLVNMTIGYRLFKYMAHIASFRS